MSEREQAILKELRWYFEGMATEQETLNRIIGHFEVELTAKEESK